MDTKNLNNYLVVTGDGSWTLRSPEYDETYHSTSGAVEEAFLKFVCPCRVEELARSAKKLRILDVCFGLGYNALAAWRVITHANPDIELEIISLEKDTALLEGLSRIKLPVPFEGYGELMKVLVRERFYQEKLRKIKIVVGDAVETIKHVTGKFQAVFWDPFSPPKNPEMWTADIFSRVRQHMEPDAVLATYSSNQRVRKGLLDAGFNIGLGPAVGRRRGGTLASVASPLPPIPEKDLEKIKNNTALREGNL